MAMMVFFAVPAIAADAKVDSSAVSITSPFGSASGTDEVLVIEKPNLTARVYRTGYGTTVVFENGWMHGPQAVDRSGRYKIVVAGRTVFDGEMTLLAYGRSKHGPFRADGSAPPVPQVTDEVRRRSGLNIGVEIPEAVLAGLPLSFPKKIQIVPGQMAYAGTENSGMGTTGSNPHIGIVPAHAARALASRDKRAVLNTLAEADAFFTWPVHYRDEKTGRPLVYADHPHASMSYSTTNDYMRGNGQNVFNPDTAHQPHPLFVAYLLTQEPYYLDEMLHWDAWNYLQGHEVGRLGALSLVRTDANYQVRAVAWVLVARAQLLSVLPRNHPSFASIAASIEANARIYRERFIDGTFDESRLYASPYATGGAKNNLGSFTSAVAYGFRKDGSVLAAGWMNAFVVQMWAYLVTLDLPVSAKAKADLDAVMRFGFKFEKRLGRNGGWDVRRMGNYGFAMGTMVGNRFQWYADHKETWRHQVSELPPLPEGGRTMFKHDSNDPVVGFDSFEANEWPAVAFAKMYGEDDGAFDAIVATDTFQRLGAGFEPQWAIFPPGMSVASVLKAARPRAATPAASGPRADAAPPTLPAVPSPGLPSSHPQGLPASGALDLPASTGHALPSSVPYALPQGGAPVLPGSGTPRIAQADPGPPKAPTPAAAAPPPAKLEPSVARAPLKPIDPAVLAKEAAANARPTAIIEDRDGLEPSEIGSVATQPRPAGYRHTVAYPKPHVRAKKGFAATPPGFGWREIPNTKLRAVATPEQGYGNINAVVEVWTGGDFSEELQLFINPPGGGHAGNDNSTFYGFDVDALQVFEFYPPSPLRDLEIKSDHAPAPEYPQATHVYDGSAWTVGRDGKPRFFFVGMRGTGDPADAAAPYAWLFDPVAMTVERGAPYQTRQDAAEQIIGVKAVGDPKRGVVFMQTTAQANQLSHYDPKRNRWFDHGDRRVGRVYGGQQLEVRYYSVLRIDPERDIAVLMGENDGIATLDLSKLKSGTPIGFTRVKRYEDMPLVTGDTSYVWDPVARDWLCYGRKGVFSMDPVTWEMKLLDANGPKPAQAGSFDRWFYSKKRDEFFTQNSVDNNWWSYRRKR